jgi:tetratricopeptide (TPR) repeat protein
MHRSLSHLCFCLSLVLLPAAATGATPAGPAGQDPAPEVTPGRAKADPGSLTGPAGQNSAPGKVQPLQGHDLYQQTLRGTAFVVNPAGMSSGTAWVLDKDARLLITNTHVVSNLSGGVVASVRVIFPVTKDGQVIAEVSYYMKHVNELAINGIVLHSDPQHDLALIQVDALPDNVRALPLAPRGAQPGDTVYSVGNPAASDALWVFDSGTVRQVYHAELADPKVALKVSARVVETQNPVNPGDSGGPLVNEEGQVVGVNESLRAGNLLTDDIDLSEVYAYLGAVRPVVSPRTAAEFAARGDLFGRAGRYDQAVADYSAALRLDSKLAVAYSHRAMAYNSLKKFDLALADCDQALALDPKDATALTERAYAHHKRGAENLALADASAALAAQPNNAEALMLQAEAATGLGDNDTAIADCNRCIEMMGQAAPPEVFYQRGLAKAGKGDRAGAIADYTEAINRAVDLAVTVEARSKLSGWLALDPNNRPTDYAEALEARGDAYRADGRSDLAKADYRRALAGAPDGSDLEARVLQKLTQGVALTRNDSPAQRG